MVIDIRDREEYFKKKTNAVNIPEHHLKDSLDMLRGKENITIICTTGEKARKICWYLQKNGIFAIPKRCLEFYV